MADHPQSDPREWRTKMRPEALIFAGRRLLKGWTVIDRLGEIRAPTLVMAGRDDFLCPPECQLELAAGIRHAPADHRARRPQSVRGAARER
jgi:pimeloyl-ACP methyl ester carboxylesterase